MKLIISCCLLALFALTAYTMSAPATIPQESEEVPEDPGFWPHTFEVDGGNITLHQPQPETFEGTDLTARAVVSVILKDKTEPVFGTVWLVAKVETDRSERVVYIRSISVPRVRFPDATVQEEAMLSSLLEKEIMSLDVEISLDRLLTSLDAAEKELVASEGLATKPPKIVFTEKSTVLILIDGEPQLTMIEGSSLMRVANTAFLVVFDGSTKKYYVYAAKDKWFESTDLQGEWKLTAKVPADVAKLEPEPPKPDPEDEVAGEANLEDTGVVPEVLVSTEPVELIQTDGEPKYSPTANNELMFVSNTDSTVILEVASQSYYVLLAGRWYKSSALEGPWQYVASDALPAAFQEIPVDSDIGDARAFVAGTSEAQDAVLDAQIPQTAEVDRKSATATVEYDGEPKFEPITGTDLQYAVNTASSVILAEGKYYLCVDGVWYVAGTPTGPWVVATERPDGVEQIPAECPVYNVKYVYIYHVTPTVVYVGYTPAYYGCYVYHGTIVYGTGYYYPGWYGSVYYGRPVTWGVGVRWNPWTGWSFGLTVSNGFFTFGIGFHRWGRCGWWGPARYHGYRRGYHRGFHNGYRHGARAGFRAGMRRSNIYHGNRRPGVSSPRPRTRPGASPGRNPGRNPGGPGAGRDPARPATRPGSGKDPGRPTTRPSTGRDPGKKNNMYADRDGNVHRRNDNGSWDRVSKDQGTRDRTGGDRTGGNRTGDRTGDRTGGNRTGGSTNRSSQKTQQNLNRAHSSRQRGSQRTQSYNRSRSSSGGGRSRGGGGGGRRR